MNTVLSTSLFLLICRFSSMRSDKEYLIEWKPLHTVVSAIVYAELKKMRRKWTAGPTALAAFGDPRHPASNPKIPILRCSLLDLLTMSPRRAASTDRGPSCVGGSHFKQVVALGGRGTHLVFQALMRRVERRSGQSIRHRTSGRLILAPHPPVRG